MRRITNSLFCMIGGLGFTDVAGERRGTQSRKVAKKTFWGPFGGWEFRGRVAAFWSQRRSNLEAGADVQALAGDEAGLIGAEEGDYVGYICRGSEMAERVAGDGTG